MLFSTTYHNGMDYVDTMLLAIASCLVVSMLYLLNTSLYHVRFKILVLFIYNCERPSYGNYKHMIKSTLAPVSAVLICIVYLQTITVYCSVNLFCF